MDFLNTPEKLNRRMIHNPMGRFGEAVEQAKAVVFRTCQPEKMLTSSRFRRRIVRQRLRLPCRRWSFWLLRREYQTADVAKLTK